MTFPLSFFLFSFFFFVVEGFLKSLRHTVLIKPIRREISNKSNLKGRKQPAVGHCTIFIYYFNIISRLLTLQICAYCSIFAATSNNKETKVGEITCPTSVIVIERAAVILYLYSALEIRAFCCKRSLIQGQTNIPPTPYSDPHSAIRVHFTGY